jgi:hypothetical protein
MKMKETEEIETLIKFQEELNQMTAQLDAMKAWFVLHADRLYSRIDYHEIQFVIDHLDDIGFDIEDGVDDLRERIASDTGG